MDVNESEFESGSIGETNPVFDSAKYWANRYRLGGNSGAGSYGRLAQFKADVINGFVAEHKLNSVIEFGCGDGAQLELARYPAYLGFDVTEESVDLCHARFAGDSTKSFRTISRYQGERGDLTLSLDVIFHLIEDQVFHDYMQRLFFSSERYVIVYSSNYDGEWPDKHVKHRKFEDWVEKYHADFSLIIRIPNKYPLANDPQMESFADFYIFEKLPARSHTLPGHLVISLTSYEKRFPTLELTLRRILQQSIVPDLVVLWISPQDSEFLPEGVLQLQCKGLLIQICQDLASYKKIIPALQRYPDSFVITLDDDQMYPRDLLEPLIDGYRSSSEILCRRAHEIKFDDQGSLLSYMEWEHETRKEESENLFATGVCGVLYPPNSLAPEVLDAQLFGELAPHADDIWLFWMARRAGSTIRRVGPFWQNVMWQGAETSSLMLHNWNGGNDKQIAAMVQHFGFPAGMSNRAVQKSSTLRQVIGAIKRSVQKLLR